MWTSASGGGGFGHRIAADALLQHQPPTRSWVSGGAPSVGPLAQNSCEVHEHHFSLDKLFSFAGLYGPNPRGAVVNSHARLRATPSPTVFFAAEYDDPIVQAPTAYSGSEAEEKLPDDYFSSETLDGFSTKNEENYVEKYSSLEKNPVLGWRRGEETPVPEAFLSKSKSTEVDVE